MPVTGDQVQRLRYERLVSIGLLVGILASHQGRLTIENALPAIMEDKELKLDQLRVGKLLAWGSFFYFIGKCLSGIAVDKVGGRAIFLASIFIPAIFCFLSSVATTFVVLTLSWCINKFYVASNWPSLTKVMSVWFSPRRYGEITGLISTSSRIGNLINCLLVAELLRNNMNWRGILTFIALIQCIIGVFDYFTVQESPAKLGLVNSQEAEYKDTQWTTRENSLDNMEWLAAIKYFLKERIVWLMIFFLCGATVLLELQSFLTLFLRQYMKMDVGHAVYAACSFQAGSIGGVVFGGFIYDHLTAKKLKFFLNFCMIMCTGCLIFFWRMLPIMSTKDVIYGLFIFGFFVSIPYYLPASIFSMVFGGQKYCATLAALLETLGFAFAMIFDYYSAVIIKIYGWPEFFGILAVTSIGTTVVFYFVSSHPTLITRKH